MVDEVISGVPNGWEWLTLGDLCDRGGGSVQTGPFGSQLHASDYVPVGVPSVMPVNIGDNRVVDAAIARVSDHDADRLARHRLRAGDIIYSRRGDVERRALIRPTEEGWLCGTGCLRIRPGHAVHSAWLSYYLGHPAVRQWIVRHAVGATMPNLNTGILSALPVALPPEREQRVIAEVLGSLDDKIDVNVRTARLQMKLAQAVWRRHARNAVTKPLGDFVEVGLSGVWGEDEEKGAAFTEVICFRGKDLEDIVARRIAAPPRRWLTTRQVASRVSPGAEIWTAGSGSLGPTLLITDRLRQGYDRPLLYSNFVKRLLPRPGMEKDLPSAWLALLDASARGDFASFTTGTAMPNLDAHAMLAMVYVPLLEGESLAEVTQFADLALDPALIMENERLVALRDALLPPLVSGRLRVREAESLVGEAV